MNPRTVFQLLDEAAAQHGQAVALYQPQQSEGRGKYKTYTWVEYRDAALEIAAGLRSLGLNKGDVIALDSETRAEFYLADLGILASGAISAALYSSYPPRDLLKTIEACDAKALFVEDPKTFEALKSAPVEQFFLLTGQADGAMSLDQLCKRGQEVLGMNPGMAARITSETSSSDDAILYLTSGATGEPKMAMVAHAAIVANLDMGPAALPIGPEDRTVAWLPSAHIAQRIAIELLPIRTGTPVYFAESLMKLPQEIKSARPTFFLAPPRMWERVYTTMCTDIRKRPAIAQRIFWGALALALKASELRQAGKPVPAYIAGPLKLADRVVFRQIRERFGGALKMPVSGAAPLGKDLAAFYDAIGMPLIEGYGLTEGGIVTLNPIDKPKVGSIGKPLAGVKIAIADDGELLLVSPTVFSRYYKDPHTTAEVMRTGVLHTGDVARIDNDGFIFITGRKKEMIVSSTGKKVFPSRVEDLFKVEPLINQILLIGDRLPYLTALFTLNPAVAETLKGMDDGKGKSLAEMASAAPVQDEVKRVVRRINKNLAPFEQIRKFRILERDLTIEQGELTATMKVRRDRVLQNFRKEIEELYAGHEDGM
ncbi:MAG: AMP-dependent synthetase/ligase [Bryobacteraceae bacterium]